MTEPVGRPSDYTVWKAKAICMRLTMGQSLRSICERSLYPSRHAVFRWLTNNEEFRDQYAQARELQQELYLDEMFEIADDSRNDYMEGLSKNGESHEKFNAEHVQRSRLRIDTRKWVMERMATKKYGAKQTLDHQSSDNSMSPKAYDPNAYKAAEDSLKSNLDDLD